MTAPGDPWRLAFSVSFWRVSAEQYEEGDSLVPVQPELAELNMIGAYRIRHVVRRKNITLLMSAAISDLDTLYHSLRKSESQAEIIIVRIDKSGVSDTQEYQRWVNDLFPLAEYLPRLSHNRGINLGDEADIRVELLTPRDTAPLYKKSDDPAEQSQDECYGCRPDKL
jgi:hypothetical protein